MYSLLRNVEWNFIMYDYIKGELVAKTQNTKGMFYTLEVNDIGYRIEVLPVDYNSKKVNEKNLKLYTVLLHKEDSMTLCGFLHRESRDIFRILTSVSGVGTKMAMALLNEFETSELISFVINENSKELTRAKGVGIKLAQKIIIELKDKLINFKPDLKSEKTQMISNEATEVQNILLSLGYNDEEIKQAILKASAIKPKSSEEFLKTALQILSM